MSSSHRRFALLWLLVSLSGTVKAQPATGTKLFSLLPGTATGINFRNDIVETSNMFMYMYENLYTGGGVAIGDINLDGLPDIYFSSTLGSNKLYLNQGNFRFKDITEEAGVNGGAGIKTGVSMVDINNDGLLDIFVNKSGFKDPASGKKYCTSITATELLPTRQPPMAWMTQASPYNPIFLITIMTGIRMFFL